MRRKILSLAIPNIVTNITVPLVGIADLAIAGRLEDPHSLAAVVIGTTIFNSIYWLFGFLRMGTSGFASQSFGAGRLDEAAYVLLRSIGIAVFFSIIILACQMPIAKTAVMMMDGSPGAENLAVNYFYGRIWGAPAVLAVYSLKGWFIGMQSPKTAMWMAVTINVVNIAASILLAFPCGLGITGIGIGSAVGQWSGVVMAAVTILLTRREMFRKVNRKLIFMKEPMKRLMTVNVDIFIRTVCLVLVFTYFTVASSASGDDTVAANALLLQLFTLFSYLMDGFAYAAESLSGRFYGAKDFSNLGKTVRGSIEWGVYLSLSVMMVYMLFVKQILILFNPSDAVLEIAMNYRWYVYAIPVCSFAAFLLDGILVGVTASKIMRNVMIAGTLGFFLALLSLRGNIGNNALWIAFLIFLLMRGILQWIFSKKILFLK